MLNRAQLLVSMDSVDADDPNHSAEKPILCGAIVRTKQIQERLPLISQDVGID
jgi:hypothetical protein